MNGRHVLVLGATGYVGGRLVPALLDAGHRVRAGARRPGHLSDRPWSDRVEVVEVDALEPALLDAAMAGVDVVVHLIHSMTGSDDFAEIDRRIATNVATAAERAGVRRIVYLGGLGSEDEQLSDHLASRHEVGQVLAEGPVPVTELRAAVVLGSGSASFEMLRGLTELLPVMITPTWVNRTAVQPVAVVDLVQDLVAIVDERFDDVDDVLDVGGPDVVTYADMIRIYAERAGLRRFIVPVPVLSPRLSSHWVGVTTPHPPSLASDLVRSLSHDVVVRDDHDIDRLVPRERLGVDAAIAQAGADEDPSLSTRWSDAAFVRRPAAPAPWDPDWTGPKTFEDVRTFEIDRTPEAVFDSLTSLGGDRRWLVANALWSLRGLLDQATGGVGLRRGRRHPSHLRTGDVVDWWRVVRLERPTTLLLEAEMRMPGRGWLRWDLEELEPGRTRIEQVATFEPSGLWGRLYWYGLLPFHGVIFPRLVERIATDAALDTAPTPAGT